MKDMLATLAELGAVAKAENATLVALTEEAQDSSHFTKTLTFIAMLYLPASLVAVCAISFFPNEDHVDLTIADSIPSRQYSAQICCRP